MISITINGDNANEVLKAMKAFTAGVEDIAPARTSGATRTVPGAAATTAPAAAAPAANDANDFGEVAGSIDAGGKKETKATPKKTPAKKEEPVPASAGIDDFMGDGAGSDAGEEEAPKIDENSFMMEVRKFVQNPKQGGGIDGAKKVLGQYKDKDGKPCERVNQVLEKDYWPILKEIRGIVASYK